MRAKQFELFHVTFRLPKFGTDGQEFQEETHVMGVSTRGGEKDAIAACEKYHSGCKVESVVKYKKGAK